MGDRVIRQAARSLWLARVRSRRRTVGVLVLVYAALLVGTSAAQAGQDKLVVFAASSTKTVLDRLMVDFSTATGVPTVASYAATSVLARQVERGAPADVVLTANAQWMKHLAQRALIDPGTRVTVAGNRLVLIAAAGYEIPPALLPIRRGLPLLAALGRDGRLAIADPRHVPAGQYGRDALQALGVWSELENRLAPAGNVRLALSLVARGNSPLGIVYRSDVIASELAGQTTVRALGEFPADSHAPVQYFAARVTDSQHAAAKRFIAFLVSPAADAQFTGLGFVRTAR